MKVLKSLFFVIEFFFGLSRFSSLSSLTSFTSLTSLTSFTSLSSLTSFTSVGAVFPGGSCKVRDCNASPVELSWISQANQEFCFRVVEKACKNPPGTTMDCCSLFDKQINKFVIAMKPACIKDISKVTVDGVKKGGGIYPLVIDTKINQTALHLTSLKFNATSAVGRVICISTKSPECGTIDRFCVDSVAGTCLYSVYDAQIHMCCPTCNFPLLDNPSLPRPPSLPPQLPRPPSLLIPLPPLPRPLSLPPPLPRPPQEIEESQEIKINVRGRGLNYTCTCVSN